jgi:hypothetical protein
MIAKIFAHRIFLFFAFLPLSTLLLFGCSHVSKINDEFIAKYGNQVKKINVARKQEIKKEVSQSKKSPQDTKRVLSKYFPESQKINSSDADFEIRYSGNYPGFRRIGAEFDEINIPQNDVYGISTNFDRQKEYLLIGNNYLQKNIDDITSYPNFKEDIEISKILIAKKQQLKLHKNKAAKKPQVKQNDDLTSDKPKQDKSDTKDRPDNDFNKKINLDNNVNDSKKS